MSQDLYQQAINTARALSIEAIEAANSGHPGLPLGAAPTLFELYFNHLQHNPLNPEWLNRDRFIMSAGHGSALLYSVLHLLGYQISATDLEQFRQLGSNTPGHPEYGCTPGVEMTTGPLGQGLATAVGMAMAERHLAARYNRPDFPVIDHYTYVLAGDGDLMEGISYEASSLAGHFGLGKLIVLYDDNKITIDGSTDITFTEDITTRYQSCGWQVITVDDGEDTTAISLALEAARSNTDQPSLIVVRTIIGNFSPLAGDAKSHGAPLGSSAVESTLLQLGFSTERAAFTVSAEVKEFMQERQNLLAQAEEKWQRLYQAWKSTFPDLAAEFEKNLAGNLPADLSLDTISSLSENQPTRVHSGRVLNFLNRKLSNLIGGSADLASSNNAVLEGEGSFSNATPEGKNIHFGVREHAMGAIVNGLILYGGLRSFAATFMIFSDYMKPSIRLSALMNIPALYILTHDSIGVGEDGPTHQPIEQLAALRATPNLNVFRPADGYEVAAGYQLWLTSQKPTALILSRQKLAYVGGDFRGALKGAYILKDSAHFQLILMASGSEVSLIIEAAEILEKENIKVRVVSMPCQNLFAEQDRSYQDLVLPPTCNRRLAVEAAASFGWHKYVDLNGTIIGLDCFGVSSKGSELFEHFGFTAEAIASEAKQLLNNRH